MEYINSNPFYKSMTALNRENAVERIRQNQGLILQVDDLIAKYTQQLGATSSGPAPMESKIVFDSKEGLDLTGLLSFKNGLIRNIEIQKIDLLKQNKIVSIINFGKTQEVNKVFVTKNYVLIPLVLVGLFFLWSFLVYLNDKAKELD